MYTEWQASDILHHYAVTIRHPYDLQSIRGGSPSDPRLVIGVKHRPCVSLCLQRNLVHRCAQQAVQHRQIDAAVVGAVHQHRFIPALVRIAHFASDVLALVLAYALALADDDGSQYWSASTKGVSKWTVDGRPCVGG